MKLIYTHENRLLVGNARNILEANGFEVVMKNEFAQGALGEAAPIETWPELCLVNEDDYPQARAAIESALTEKNAPGWVCSGCGENNGAAFELCWNCQTENQSLTE